MLAELRGYGGAPARDQPARTIRAADLLLPIHFKTDEFKLRMFSTIMTLGTPQDVTLQELRVETFFPADEESERTWRAVSES